MRVSDFDFELPTELIATRPLERRDQSRMLVVGETLSDDVVSNFPKFLRPGDVVVMNDSRVIPSRFTAAAGGGKTYEITLHTNLGGGEWLGLAKKFQQLQIGEELTLSDGTKIKISDKSDDGLTLGPLAFETLERVGKIPLPPYMRREDDAADRDRYQTIYAATAGSMAAPTAGLHFTPELLKAVENAGAKIVKITLHVGAGTFLPVKSEDTSGHKMHSEFGAITQEQADTINGAKRVIAVGTTSIRLLESSPPVEGCPQGRGGLSAFSGTTNIFITPGYKFKTADILLTNFHLPKSTLFMLVSAFAGLPEMQSAYAHAILEKYRFFSYGDCCLIYGKEPK
ncbi:MAG: tRNA preQ1(34) S-adenosylmethionine ribosyltransferase-isomerase QueA [Rickettsiales bacterium]|jgi:S-adenosylmethionine:tRNA ribosyltransferase-isomerase|nr:tRNA preQ1(34) S-adenosylmethionine ribosyltransferase-isomerase QueA [Rickettsiales bacterium]